MSQPFDLMTHRCPQCGQPVEQEGLCPLCRPQEPQQGEWKVCNPAMPDCDCPIIGYAKFHLPGCKYF
ncbi:MAG: hypothetical protein K9K66_06645 [Desulfarculaceae bacterium]|nr:hypothetical protein [Desulfarculaceae bacterium]MCF8071767.1 hypothetical protein [Desulfarculaceae bacterium]MCF8101317.1 hypothetical protein [Desulfarculaceae bacterium]MCF8117276.1 hypothetical protein [Desulfarculaceae bacterium]